MGSGLVGVRGPGQGVGVDDGVEQHLEGSGVLDAEFVVLLDIDLGEERLAAQAPVGVVSPPRWSTSKINCGEGHAAAWRTSASSQRPDPELGRRTGSI
ncbi:hypothetical protein [Okibacterium endophyticum]